MGKIIFKNSRGQIQIIILAAIIILGVLLSGYGISFKKSKTDQTPVTFEGGNQNQNPVPETFTSSGTCCDRGDGTACQLVDSDCFNFRGSDYCRIKSNTAFMEDWSWLDNTEATHKGNPVYVNLTEEVNTCVQTEEEGAWIPDGQDELYVGGCTKVPNDIMIYVCKNDCPIITKMQLPTGQWIPDSARGGQNAVYDVYFKKNEPIPSFISFCSKTFSPVALLPIDKVDRFRDLFKKKVEQKTQEEPSPTTSPTIGPKATDTSSRKSLQIDVLDLLKKKETQKKAEETVKKEIEKTLAPWFSPYCKPAIYLYPETLSLINVKVVSNQPFTYTDPPYPDNGWNVLANPNGLINYGNRFYDYLYYETQVLDSNIKKPEEGFIVERKNIKSFLFSLLPKVGLNLKETIQFSDYWDSVLPSSPYYFIGIITPKNLDSITSLAITPKPKTIIRVTLYFEALDKKIEVKSPKISTPNRSGFTVVEWGGIYKKHKNEAFSCFL